MPCSHLRVGGSDVIACSRQPRRRRCHYCNAWATMECDFPAPGRRSGTCDRPICPAHATPVGKNRDYCDPKKNRRHPRLEEAA